MCFNKVFLTGEVASSLFFAMCDFSVVMVSSPFSSLELCSLSKSGLQVVDISQVPSNHAIFSHETSFLNSPDKFPEPESRSECAQHWGVHLSPQLGLNTDFKDYLPRAVLSVLPSLDLVALFAILEN